MHDCGVPLSLIFRFLLNMFRNKRKGGIVPAHFPHLNCVSWTIYFARVLLIRRASSVQTAPDSR